MSPSTTATGNKPAAKRAKPGAKSGGKSGSRKKKPPPSKSEPHPDSPFAKLRDLVGQK